MSAEKLDFDEEARKLWQQLNLDIDTMKAAKKAPTNHMGIRGYVPQNRLDAIWRHPKHGGGTIYCGDEQACKDLALLQQHGIDHVVNCTDNIRNYHERANVKYLRFEVAFWSRHITMNQRSNAGGGGSKDGNQAVVKFFAPLWQFMSAALEAGTSVLIHCLAGAHRAGTTSVASLMYYGGIHDR
jgi:hypothetical protein